MLTRWLDRIRRRTPARSRARAEGVEPRILYSADLLVGAAAMPAPEAQVVRSVDADTSAATTAPATVAAVRAVELVVVDPGVTDAQALVDAIAAQRPEAGLRIVLLDAGRDGLAQIGEALASMDDVSAVHVLAHGEPGELTVCGRRIDAAALDAEHEAIGAWRGALTEQADLLLYGCSLASNAAGIALLERLAALTGADVSASDDPTGSAAAGGDWSLELATGSIEARTLFAAADPSGWQGLLDGDAPPVNTVPGPQTATEDVPLAITGLSVSDADDDLSAVSLAVGRGTLALVLDGGATIGDGSNGSSSLTLTGTSSQITAALATLTYLGAADASGADTLTVTSTDAGGRTATDTVAIDVSAVNDPPTLNGDLQATVAEGGSVVLGASDLGFTDPDTLPADVVFTVSDLVGGEIRVAGTVATSFTGAELQAGSVAFRHDGAETTTASFRIALEDGDADGSTPQSATFALTVDPVNDAPLQTLPGNTSTGLDTPHVFGTTGGNAISVSDPDGAGRLVQITVQVDHGTVTLARTTGLTFAVGTGTNTAAMTFTGTVADVNAAFDGLAYTPGAGFRGLERLRIQTDDLANGGGATGVVVDGEIDIHVGAIVVTATDDTVTGDTGSIEALIANDGGDGISLREALLAANASPGTQHVLFEFAGAGPPVIAIGSALPAVTGTVVIDGTLALGYAGNGGRPVVVVDGGGLAADGLVFQVGSQGSLVRGLELRGFAGDGIELRPGADGITIAGNWIGAFDAGGDRDTVPGIAGAGIRVGSTGNLVGGAGALDGNRLNVAGAGIVVGDTVSASAGATILGNSIVALGGPAIDLGGDGPTANDAADVDAGPNGLQNAPELTAALVDAGGMTVQGAFEAPAGTHWRVEVFSSPTGAPGEARVLLGVFAVVAGASGRIDFTAYLQGAQVSVGHSVTATATRELAPGVFGPSSELGAPVSAMAAPSPLDPPGTTVFTEDGGPVAVFPGLFVIDPDSATLQGATVRFATGTYSLGQDVLSFTDPSGITGSWNAATGVLTLTGQATLAQYQAALRSVTYTNTSQDPGVDTRLIVFIIDDGDAPRRITTRELSIVAVDDLPAAQATSATGAEDDASIVVTLRGTDVDSEIQDVELTGLPANGTLYLDAGLTVLVQPGTRYAATDGVLALWFVPAADWNGTTGFGYTVRSLDGAVSATAATATIVVTAVNDAPSLSDATLAAVDEDAASPTGAPVQTLFGAGFSDPDTGDSLAGIAIVGDPGNAAQGTWQYSTDDGASWHPVDMAGADGAGLVLGATARLRFLPAADAFGPVSPLTVRALDDTWSGGFTAGAGRVVVDVSMNGAGTPIAAGVALLRSTISAAPDAPVVIGSGDAAPTFVEDGEPVVVDANLVVSDVDDASIRSALVRITTGHVPGQGVLVFTSQSGITSQWDMNTGTLTLSGDATAQQYQAALRSVTYANTSQAPSAGMRTIVFTVSDGVLDSLPVGRIVQVVAVADPPQVGFGAISGTYVEQAAPTVLDAAATVSDVDSGTFAGGTLTVSITANASADDHLAIANIGTAEGAVSVSGNGVSYGGMLVGTYTGGVGETPLTLTLTANANAAAVQAVLRAVVFEVRGDAPSDAPRTIEVVMTDGDGGTSAARSMRMDVTAVADPSTLVRNSGLSATELGTITIGSGSLGWSDADTAAAGIEVRIESAPLGGELRLNGTLLGVGDTFTQADINLGGVTYTHTDPSRPADVFSLSATDGSVRTAIVPVAVTINLVNDAPILTAPTGIVAAREDGIVVFSDVDGTRIVIADDVDAAALVEVYLSVDGDARLALSGIDGLTLVVGQGRDDAVLTIRGTLVDVNAALDGLRLVPAGNAFGLVRLQIEVNDLGSTGLGGSKTASAQVRVGFEAVNDPPQLSMPESAEVLEDGRLVLDEASGGRILVADIDNEGGLRLRLSVSSGTLTLASTQGLTLREGAGTGSALIVVEGTRAALQAALDGLRFTPSAEWSGTVQLDLLVDDGAGGFEQGRTTIEVLPVDDAPVVAVPALQTVAAGETLLLSAARDAAIVVSDVDGSLAPVTVALSVGVGRLSVTSSSGVVLSASGDGGLGGMRLTLDGPIDAVNAALATLRYQPPVGWSGELALTVTIALQDAAPSAPNTLTLKVLPADNGGGSTPPLPPPLPPLPPVEPSAPGSGPPEPVFRPPAVMTQPTGAAAAAAVAAVAPDRVAGARDVVPTGFLRTGSAAAVSTLSRGVAADDVAGADPARDARFGEAALRIALDGPREGGERTDTGQAAGVADGTRDGAKRSDASGDEIGGLALIGVGPDSNTFALLMDASAAPSVEPTDVPPVTVPGAARDDASEFAAPVLTLNQGAELAGVALTAGMLWWAIYGGATVWLLIATGPVARTFDPLPILARDDVDLPHDQADELFDGTTGLDAEAAGRRAAGPRRAPVAAWMSS
jgi:VCBS repeat-containing protein